jgi:CHAD domain-containing protein
MGKWLLDVSPDARAADVAARALADRLDAVRRYLQRAANGAAVEDVHQLRVWTRRSEAALALYADLVPRKHLRWFRKWVKRVRRAAGRVRDADVLAARLTTPDEKWPVRLRAERWRGRKQIRKLADRLADGRRLKRRTRKMLARMAAAHARSRERFADRARLRLRPLAAAFLAAAPPVGAEDAALHRFRIRGKELRYAMELLAAAFPPAFREELYPLGGELQERLGRVNDLATAQGRLEEWLAGTGDPATISNLRRRLADVMEELVRARAEFHAWWSPELREQLRARFAEVLGSPSAPR